MRYIWEDKDVNAGRRVYDKEGVNGFLIGSRFSDNNDFSPSILSVVSLETGHEIHHFSHFVNDEGEEVTAAEQMANWFNLLGWKPQDIQNP